jgi:predicted dienelactone hydrolase
LPEFCGLAFATLALANAGYLVAALMHTGDNHADQDSNVPYATHTRLVERPAHSLAKRSW